MTALIAVEHHSVWLSASFLCHFKRFGRQFAIRGERYCPTHRFPREQLENNCKVCPALTCPDIRHVAAPHLIWLCDRKLPLKMIRNSDVFVTPTFISMSRLLATDQPQIFHQSASKPASHPIASLGCHCGDAPCSGRTMADVMQLHYLTS